MNLTPENEVYLQCYLEIRNFFRDELESYVKTDVLDEASRYIADFMVGIIESQIKKRSQNDDE